MNFIEVANLLFFPVTTSCSLIMFTVAVLSGQFIELEHCLVRHSEGEVTLVPLQGALCSVGNVRIHEPTKLNQGLPLELGKFLTFSPWRLSWRGRTWLFTHSLMRFTGSVDEKGTERLWTVHCRILCDLSQWTTCWSFLSVFLKLFLFRIKLSDGYPANFTVLRFSFCRWNETHLFGIWQFDTNYLMMVQQLLPSSAGAIVRLGRNHVFRFNHPREAARLREEMKEVRFCLKHASCLVPFSQMVLFCV